MAEGSSMPAIPSSTPEPGDQSLEARYRMMTDHVSDVIVRADAQGTLLYVSGACRAWGYEPEELIGRMSGELVHPDDLERLNANAAQLFSGAPIDRAVNREIRYRRKGGGWVWLEGNPQVIRDESGRPVEILNVFRDVTDRKRAEMAAREADAERRANVELFENAFHHAPIGMALVGLDGRFLKINAAFCKLVGYPEPRMLGLDFQTITHPDDLTTDLGLLAKLQAGEIPNYQMDKRYVRSDGALVWVRLSVSMVKQADGRPKHFISQVQDLTASRAAKRALAQSEQRFRRLADNAPDMIAQSRLDGVMTYVSPACLAITGFTQQELVGRPFTALMHPEDGEKVAAMCQAVLDSEGTIEPWPIEFRTWHKDGRALWLECRPTPAKDPLTGRFVSLHDVVRDVTQRKALEAELRRARAEAEAAAAVKGEFLANMSHEIRTPLTAILGFAGLLAEHPGLDQVGRGHLQRVLTAGQSLLSIVNDVLDFSKLEAGHADLAPRPIAPIDFVREALSMFTDQAAAKGLTLDFLVEGPPPALVALDPDRFRQTLTNLIGNAVKFTREGGVRVRLRYEAPQSRLHVAVEDTGPGIGEADQAKLFQRFAQVDGSTTRQHGGAGLGLAICKGLTEAMGGQIGVRSKPGHGSIFSFHVLAPVEHAPPQSSQENGPALEGVRVLVVDDSPVNRELARVILENAGVEVTLADGGDEALRMAAVAPYDLILLDRRMPGMDGSETLRRIRAAPGPNDAIPVLAFSADSDPEGLLGQGGFEDIVGKPLNAAVLIDTVSKWTRWSAPALPERQAARAGERDAGSR